MCKLSEFMNVCITYHSGYFTFRVDVKYFLSYFTYVFLEEGLYYINTIFATRNIIADSI